MQPDVYPSKCPWRRLNRNRNVGSRNRQDDCEGVRTQFSKRFFLFVNNDFRTSQDKLKEQLNILEYYAMGVPVLTQGD